LRHVPVELGMVDQIEARYRARGLRTVFRLANEPALTTCGKN
jgi:hypothetical protein